MSKIKAAEKTNGEKTSIEKTGNESSGGRRKRSVRKNTDKAQNEEAFAEIRESNGSGIDRVFAPLKNAASRIACILCEISENKDFFIISEKSPEKRVDTKTLKEFSGVIKEMSAVVSELYGPQKPEEEGDNSVRIEFSEDAFDCGG